MSRSPAATPSRWACSVSTADARLVTGFSIPRVAIPSTLLQTAGGKREGEIYVMERFPQHAGRETPLDMLNRAEGFFPFRPKGDGAGVQLVAKARTVSLTVPLGEPEDKARLSAAKQARFEVTLADGTQLRGWAILRHRDRRWSASRKPRACPVRAPGGLIHGGTARSVSRRDAARARRSAVSAAGRAGHAGQGRQAPQSLQAAAHRSAYLRADGRGCAPRGGGQDRPEL